MILNEIRTFEDLEAWKNGRKLTKSIYSLTQKDSFSRDFGLLDQIRRAATSVMFNPVKYLSFRLLQCLH